MRHGTVVAGLSAEGHPGFEHEAERRSAFAI